MEVADVPLAYIPSKKEFSLLQMDGEISREELKRALELGEAVSKKIIDVQTKALKEKYTKK